MDKISTGGKKSQPISAPDTLTKTSKKGSVELTEDELDKASGDGAVAGRGSVKDPIAVHHFGLEVQGLEVPSRTKRSA